MTAHDPTDDGDTDGEQGTTREQEPTWEEKGTTREEYEPIWEEQSTTRGESKSGGSPADSTDEVRSLDCRSVVEPDEDGIEVCTIYDMSDPRTKQTAWLSAEDDSFVDLEAMQ